MRRRYRRPSTRDEILEQLKKAVRDTLTQAPRSAECKCHECRVARARDVTPDPRILQVQPADLERMKLLARQLLMDDPALTQYTLRMFGKVPVLLREIEAAAVIAHLERGDV